MNKIILKEGQKVLDKKGNSYIIEKGDLLQEGIEDNMTIGEFCKEVEESYNSYFPNSKCNAGIYKSLGSNISIKCFFANDKSELPNGISENDLFSLSFLIMDLPRDIDEDSPMPDIIKFESSLSSITTKPTDRYMAFGREKITFRKFTGTPEKAILVLDKHFGKFYDTTVRLYKEDMIPESILELVDIKRKI